MQTIGSETERARIQSAGLALAGFGAAIALLYYGRSFCITLVISVILAFMLEPFVQLFIRIRLPRKLASLLVCTIALLVVYLAGFGLVSQLAGFADDLPVYSRRANDLVDRVAARLENAERDAYRLIVPRRYQDPARLQTDPSGQTGRRRRLAAPAAPPVQEVRIRQDGGLFSFVAGYASSVYHMLLMISFIPFLVYFMLSWRDHIHKTVLSIYGDSDRAGAGRSWDAIAGMAHAYVAGNVILGLIIALVSSVVFWSWSLPYWVLIGFVSGFLSLIPYIGLPLALVPPIAAALMVYDAVTPFLIITVEVAILHLLALNFLYPSVVGSRVHLNPLAVTIALMFWGTIWGGIGLVLAIPLTAALKAVLDNTDKFSPYGRLLGDYGGDTA